MKSFKIRFFGMISLVLAVLLITACDNSDSVTQNGPYDFMEAFEEEILNMEAENPDSSEVQSLLFMREEEKLAMDVYTFLYAEWGVRIFNNISQSENRHASAIAVLLQKYNIEDPAAALAAGEFANPFLQELYNGLVHSGSVSLTEALVVGARIGQFLNDDRRPKTCARTGIRDAQYL